MRWHWQYAGAIALYVLNVDWVIMPKLKLLGFGNWLLFITTCLFAVFELYFGYLFWDWFRRVAVPEFAKYAAKSEVVQEAREISTEIKNELKKYSADLAKKPEYLFLSKSDIAPAGEIKKKIAILKKINKNVLPISVYDWNSLEKVKKILNKIKAEK